MGKFGTKRDGPVAAWSSALLIAAIVAAIALPLRWPLADLARLATVGLAVVVILGTIERAVAHSLVLWTSGAVVYPAAAYLVAALIAGS